MIKQLQKVLLLLCALIVGGSAWAVDVTYKLTISPSDFNSTSYAANNNEKTSQAVCTTDASKKYEVKWTSYQVMLSGTTNMQWQKSKGSIYNSTDLGTITNVTVTSSAGTFTTYYGTSAAPTSGTTVGNGYFNVKVGGATGTTSKVEVTFVVSETPAAALTSISVSGQKTAFYVGDSFSFGGTVTAHYDDSTTDDVTGDATFSGYDLSTSGTQTVTVTYSGKTTTYGITVSERPKFTVTYSDGGSVTEESVGAGVTLASRSNVGEYTFLGWAESEVATETKVAPEYATGTYHPADNITLYPVYKRTIVLESALPNATMTVAAYASANSWSNTTQYTTMNINDALTATASSGTNTGKYYFSDNSWRMYSSESATLTIEAASGYQLTSVTLTYSEGAFTYGGSAITSGSSVEVSGTSAVFVCTTKAFVNSISVGYKQSTTTYYVSTPITTIDIALNAACTDGTKYYGTFSSSHGFVVPSGLTVSEIKVVDGKLSVTNYDEDDVVPAYTGVMIASTSAGAKTVTLASGGTSVLGSDNMLKASGDAGITAANMTVAGTKFYRLTMHNGTDIGFWWGAADGAAFDIAANKAYLAVPTADAARIQAFWFEDEVNGIDNPQLSTLNSQPTYTLSGQRVEKAKKGLYIVNGKKCVIR